MSKKKYKRVKILNVDPDVFIQFINWWRNPTTMIALPITDELPEDAKVISIQHSWPHRCIQLLIESESFDPIPEYHIPPEISPGMEHFRTISFKELMEMKHIKENWQLNPEE